MFLCRTRIARIARILQVATPLTILLLSFGYALSESSNLFDSRSLARNLLASGWEHTNEVMYVYIFVLSVRFVVL